MSKTKVRAYPRNADRDLYSGLIRLHVLHHAVEEPIFGLGMIEELVRHGYRISPGKSVPAASRAGEEGLPAVDRAAQRQVPAEGLPSDAAGPESAGGGQEQGAGAVSRTHRGRIAIARKCGNSVPSSSHCRLGRDGNPVGSKGSGRGPPGALTLEQAVVGGLEELSFDPGFAGADQCRRRRHPTRAHGLPAASRRHRPGESRHPQQRLRAAAAAGRDSFDLRPVIGTNNLGTVWGSAIGALVTWEPFDFGLRSANVAAATAARAQSEATLKRTQFDDWRCGCGRLSDACRGAGDRSGRAGRRGPRRDRSPDHRRAGERATAPRRRPVARRSRTRRRAHPTDPGAAGRRCRPRDLAQFVGIRPAEISVSVRPAASTAAGGDDCRT